MQPDKLGIDTQLERRGGLELRADGNKITGHAIVFDVRSRDLGGFVEVVKPAAVERALAGDVVALYNHDPGAVLGRTPKTLTLTRDARGLAFTLDPAPTQAGRDALELVRRGDVTGAWTRDGATTIRTLLDVEIFEISLTALPSYTQTDVSVALRSLAAGKGLSIPPFQPSIAALRRQLRAR
jgi:HK97 family phage prohead protease